MRNFSNIAAILILPFITCAICSDESFDSSSNTLKMSSSCMEGFNACKDFMTNRHCLSQNIWKRQGRADGPFWANRGKRDPTLLNSRLYAEEPRWELVRRDDDSAFDPFFTTRGKKLQQTPRDRRAEDKMLLEGVSPFLAARGKKDFAE